MVKVCVVSGCKPQTQHLKRKGNPDTYNIHTVKCSHCIAVYCVHAPYILPISKSPCTLVFCQSNIESP